VGEDAFKGVINVVTNNSAFKNNGADFTNAYIDDEDLSLLYSDASQKKIVGCYKSNIIAPPVPNSVREIGYESFRSCYALTSIVIPSNVTSIGYGAFERCSGLTSVTVEATTPPTLGTWAFDDNAERRKIYVPSASVDAYKAAEGWSTYAEDILPIQ
jgi:hypothetical protein